MTGTFNPLRILGLLTGLCCLRFHFGILPVRADYTIYQNDTRIIYTQFNDSWSVHPPFYGCPTLWQYVVHFSRS